MITVILNPTAGAKRNGDTVSRLTNLFSTAGLRVQIVSSGSADEAAAAARAAMKAGCDAVVAVGGDGTVSSIASALVGSNVPLGVLPLGTLNHFARDLGIPTDLEQAVEAIAAGRSTRVDVGEANDRTFLNNSSLGIYPDIVLEREALRRKGYRKWTAFVVASARILRNYRGPEVRITAPDSTETARTPFLMVGNNEYQVDGSHLGERKRLDGGRLFAYLAPRVRARELPKLLALALAGRVRAHHALEVVAARELRVETAARSLLPVALDGEVVLMAAPLNYRVRPLALRVIVP